MAQMVFRKWVPLVNRRRAMLSMSRLHCFQETKISLPKLATFDNPKTLRTSVLLPHKPPT